MATNDFLPFAGTVGSLVTSQADWVTLLGSGGALEGGFQNGIADAAQVNKALRQGTAMASAIASLAADSAGVATLDNGDVAALSAAILRGLGKLICPPGLVAHFAMSTPPTGWLKANGAVVSQTTYADLYAAIGGTYNTGGEGAGNFRLPDLRGVFARGLDDGRGVDSGRAIGSDQSASAGTITGSTAILQVQSSSSSGSYTLDQLTLNGVTWNDNTAAQTITVTPGDTRPRNVALLACIRY